MKMNYLKFQPKKLTKKQAKKVFILFLVKLGFKDLDPSNKVDKARQIVEAMTGNPNFTTPTPTLLAVTAAADTLDVAQLALDGTKIKTVARNNAEKALDTIMAGLQGYVEAVCMRNEEKILSSGFEVRNPNTKAEILPAPTGLTAVSTQIEGEVKLKWNSSGSSKVLYIIEMAPDNFPSPVWQPIGESTKATFTAEDLQSGQKFRFRVSVINTAGESGYSEEAACRPN